LRDGETEDDLPCAGNYPHITIVTRSGYRKIRSWLADGLIGGFCVDPVLHDGTWSMEWTADLGW
jgi:hypothetical protein